MANKQPIVISGGRLANIDAADTLDVPMLNITAADSFITIPEHATSPATPASGKVVIYAKADGLLYIKDDVGTETPAGPGSAPVQCIPIAASDETTPLVVSVAMTFRMPYAFTLSKIKASLTTAQATDGAGGIFTIDVKEGGSSVFSTLLTIDNTHKTSATATTPAVISDPALADDAEMTIEITQIGDGTAAGLKVYLIGTAT